MNLLTYKLKTDTLLIFSTFLPYLYTRFCHDSRFLMNREEIKIRLQNDHRQFTELILSLTDHDFLLSANDKWTAGQQLDHIYRSVAALTQALILPKFVIKLITGKTNRPSRDYGALVAKYQSKLAAGGRATGRFVPKVVLPDQKDKLKSKLLKSVGTLCKRVDRYNEKQLDYYILPHPLLGKLTLREMLFFTIYHVEHHRQLTLKNLGQ